MPSGLWSIYASSIHREAENGWEGLGTVVLGVEKSNAFFKETPIFPGYTSAHKRAHTMGKPGS